MRIKCLLLVFLWFVLPPIVKTPARIFTISMSNDVVSRKDVYFGLSAILELYFRFQCDLLIITGIFIMH